MKIEKGEDIMKAKLVIARWLEERCKVEWNGIYRLKTTIEISEVPKAVQKDRRPKGSFQIREVKEDA